MANSIAYQGKKFRVGDEISVSLSVKDGEKERIQNFKGILIAIKGSKENCMIMVRKIAKGNVGVERIFPLHSPWIKAITLIKTGKSRRAKLYYLRSER